MAALKGGDKLAKRLAAMGKALNSAKKVQTGFPKGGTYPDGTSVPMVAAIQEFGAPKVGIPPRPFMRTTFAAENQKWAGNLAALITERGYDARSALTAVGEVMQADIKEGIASVSSPPLSPVTVMLRGMKSHDQSLEVTRKTVGEAAARVDAGLTNYGASDKPLHDSGFMIDSVKSVVS